MARKKQYKEEEVLEKAMNLFWIKGYENTSLEMLEKEMGINKFSIYSSFGSKKNLFIESLKLYRKKVGEITNQLEKSSAGVVAIKQYFYDFLKLSAGKGFSKGCLMTNTLMDIDKETDNKILRQVESFRDDIRQVFLNKLITGNNESLLIAEKKADYLLISMIGLSSASKITIDTQLENYIDNTFKTL
ncbi:TetR/AcrR family transcriptional regulator [Nonlabens ulvanivorans]|uniref:TetR/AcrR family transcriptional regulator n=1 Tax=Nonlabens ulvanivorans TaxID=906888 RepID=UPI00294204FB|nr:TetR/AcrR family transcriptional regulator [Nonlabens ulvanivorans]WOI23320.1 TetR/AcrR family transcriptional regulator [Nonlabens ulvanivorans]